MCLEHLKISHKIGIEVDSSAAFRQNFLNFSFLAFKSISSYNFGSCRNVKNVILIPSIQDTSRCTGCFFQSETTSLVFVQDSVEKRDWWFHFERNILYLLGIRSTNNFKLNSGTTTLIVQYLRKLFVILKFPF